MCFFKLKKATPLTNNIYLQDIQDCKFFRCLSKTVKIKQQVKTITHAHALHRIYRKLSALLYTLVGLTVKVISTYGMGHVQWWQSIVRKTKNFGNPYGRDSMGPKLTELAWTAVLFKRL